MKNKDIIELKTSELVGYIDDVIWNAIDWSLEDDNTIETDEIYEQVTTSIYRKIVQNLNKR